MEALGEHAVRKRGVNHTMALATDQGHVFVRATALLREAMVFCQNLLMEEAPTEGAGT
jgi:hypothetical protein